MSIGRHDRRGGIAVPALAKFGEYLQASCLEELTRFLRGQGPTDNRKNFDHEPDLQLLIQALIENDKNLVTDYVESGLNSLDPTSVAHRLRQIRELKKSTYVKDRRLYYRCC